MIAEENMILRKFSMWKKDKRIVIGFIIFVLIVVVFGGFLLFNHQGRTQFISGKLFIDGEAAPAGVGVKLVFPSGEAADVDGTDEFGNFSIDVTDFVGEAGTFFINYAGETFIGSDQHGNYYNFNVSEDILSSSLDVFISVTDDTQEDDSDQDSDNQDDSNGEDEDDSNDSNDSDDTEDDQNDEESDDEMDDDQEDSDDGSEDESDDDPDDSGDDTPDYENESSLQVFKQVWKNESEEWVDVLNIEKNEVVQFNITVLYNGSFNVTDVHIIDYLSEHMVFIGNATVNDVKLNPEYDKQNDTLLWNISSLEPDTYLTMLFNCSINAVANYSNRVNVTVKEHDNQLLSAEDTSNIRVYGDLIVDKSVWDDDSESWKTIITVEQEKPILFNVSVSYHGSFLIEDVMVIDLLPENMSYAGNATVNADQIDPMIDELNNTLKWVVDLQEKNPCIIHFEVNIIKNKTYENRVFISGNESIGTHFAVEDNATVKKIGFQDILCKKLVKSANLSWQDEIDAYVGDEASFNISFTNTGNTTLYNLNILDTLPSSLKYVNGSTRILFHNNTFFKEPDISNEFHFLLWTNLNEIIHDYIDPNETMTIIFNVSIVEEGRAKNNVNITSTLCNQCDPLTASDQAIINASIRILDLSVDAGGPYYDFVNQLHVYTASASGGISPYRYSWNLDDDGEFDDGNGSSISNVWDEIGNYTIHVKVSDQQNTTATATTFVNVSIPPLMVDAGGPYESFAGNNISFSGSAMGGVGNYTWFWDFGDGNTSTFQNPIHKYLRSNAYIVTLTVTDEENTSKNDTAQVMIWEEDTVPPVISINKPIDAIYLRNRAIFPFFNSLVFGDINISVSATDNKSSVDYIELYVNDDLVKTFFSAEGDWMWNETVFGRHVITVKAYDVAGMYASIDKVIWKFF